MVTKAFTDKGNALAFKNKASRDGYHTKLHHDPADGLWIVVINYR